MEKLEYMLEYAEALPYSQKISLLKRRNLIIVNGEIALAVGNSAGGKKSAGLLITSAYDRTISVRTPTRGTQQPQSLIPTGRAFEMKKSLYDGDTVLLDDEYEIQYSKIDSIKDEERVFIVNSKYPLTVRTTPYHETQWKEFIKK